VGQNFDAIFRLPMVKLHDKGSEERFEPGWARLREFVTRRLLYDLVLMEYNSLLGMDLWLRAGGAQHLQRLSYRREALAEMIPATLVFWLTPGDLKRFSHEAPDLWAWRTAVADFSLQLLRRDETHRATVSLGAADLQAKRSRVAQIAGYLADKPGLSDADTGLLLEAAAIHEMLGEWDQAVQAAKTALACYDENDDRRGVANAQGKIADILQARGELDEALRIREEEELPVYERLGDVREKSVALFKIGTTDARKGDRDRALEQVRQAFDIAAACSFADGIGHVGLEYGRMLLERHRDQEAAQVLMAAVKAFERLGNEASRNKAETLLKGLRLVRGEDRAAAKP